jgi:RNA polymerase sigma-70 factor (ECF subfamily)
MIKVGGRAARLDETGWDEASAAHDQSSDARVVEAVRRGDREAFGVLVARYERKLQRVLRRLVRDPEQARDLAQETFLRVYEHLDRFDTSRRFGPWLFRVGVNLAVDWLRRHRPMVRLSRLTADEDKPVEVVDPDPRPRIDLGQEVHWVLQQIPLAYRKVLVLRDLEGFSCSEVAAIEGRREATIRWRLSRAREMFRKIWEVRQKEERQDNGA